MMDDLTGGVVVVAVRDANLASAIVRRFESAGARVARVMPEPTGHASQHSWDTVQAVDRVLNTEGRIDVWIQDAHSEILGEVARLTPQVWEEGLNESFGLALAGAKAVGSVMQSQGSGTVIFLTSVDGFLASAGRGVACCGAAAVMMLVKVLAAEWASRGVRINAVASTTWLAPPLGPDAVETTAAGVSPSRIPLGRPPRADEVAEAIFYLGSPGSSFVTGESLRLDGGWTGYHLF